MQVNELKKLAKLVRYYTLVSTAAAGSGHPTSSLSATDLMTVLFFKYFRFDLDNPDNPNNDRLIFSKGHASPLFYSLYAAAGKIKEEDLLKLRTFDSPLEGHPMPRFEYTEVPTGSLGQGLSVGVGEALALRARSPKSQIPNPKQNTHYSQPTTHNLQPHVYVLLGDGEMAEGSVWEAIEIAGYYNLNNLVGILDVNRLGQSGKTMLGHNVEAYAKRVEAFGWNTAVSNDGHDLEEIDRAYSSQLTVNRQKPLMIIAKTIKGKGVSFIEDKEGWHGKPLAEVELKRALVELGEVSRKIVGVVHKPASENPKSQIPISKKISYIKYQISKYRNSEKIATRKAYGNGLVRLGKIYSDVVVLDAEVKNSTYSEEFKKIFPERFYEMFIAEQNMIGTALGMARLGFVPFASSFACFLTRAADQIRMAGYSDLHVCICGSHAGVSIGEDGPSQMGLEDLALFRSVLNSTVFYPADGVSAERMVEMMYKGNGLIYLRTSRPKTPIIYGADEEFVVGGSKVFSIKNQESRIMEKATIIVAGITLHEALEAQKLLKQENIAVRVIDCYSIKPIDVKTLKKAAAKTKAMITVEDHYPVGGLGDAVLEALAPDINIPVYKMAVTKIPRSGSPEELLDYEGISATAIVRQVQSLL